jgi:aerotaxis receptor
MLVSTTDAKGHITHCNHAFVAVSGFSYEELIVQSHNLVRHPDMPPEAYRDMWQTIGRGRPWTGMVKNRRKNGDHYWVQANVTPILDQGKPRGYMSVRIKPTPQQVQAAEALYSQMRASRDAGQKRPPMVLRGGEVRYTGLRGLAGRLRRVTITGRLGLGLAGMVLLGMLPQLVEAFGTRLPAMAQLALQLASLVVGALLLMTWFSRSFGDAISAAEHFANDLAGCNLRDGCFLEARIGHARVTGADLVGWGFRRDLQLSSAQLSVFTAREITITSSTSIKVEWSNWINFTLVPTGE